MRSLSEDDIDTVAGEYAEHGFAYVRQMFTAAELAPLAAALDDGAAPGGFSVLDSLGGRQELTVWLELGNDLIGVIPRLAPLAEIAARLVGDPVYHWHSKLSWKRPFANTNWDWHQDFAFWTREGPTEPNMCTIAIAIGPVTEANGCMRLVPGSHHLGTLEVVDIGPSQGADPEAVEAALDSRGEELCEMEPGDVLVFHSNTLHGSGPNESDVPRTILMASYNSVSNAPPVESDSAYRLRPFDVVPAEAIADGWTRVFGDTPFIDPAAQRLGQGYEVEPVNPRKI